MDWKLHFNLIRSNTSNIYARDARGVLSVHVSCMNTHFTTVRFIILALSLIERHLYNTG